MCVSFSGVTEAVGRSGRAFSACPDGPAFRAEGPATGSHISMRIQLKLLRSAPSVSARGRAEGRAQTPFVLLLRAGEMLASLQDPAAGAEGALGCLAPAH